MSNINHNFLFASLRSTQPLTTRRVHIRRLYDVLQLCIHRQDYARARCAWAILIRCREIEWKFLWTIGLLLVGGLDSADVNEGRVDYLRSLMLQHLDQREIILTELIHCLIVTGKYKEALDELELYLPSYPFQDNPIFHIYAGLLSLYFAQDASEDESRYSTLLREAQSHLERATELDPDNRMAQAFLDKVTELDRSRQAPDADSDQEITEVGEHGASKTKRVRTSSRNAINHPIRLYRTTC